MTKPIKVAFNSDARMCVREEDMHLLKDARAHLKDVCVLGERPMVKVKAGLRVKGVDGRASIHNATVKWADKVTGTLYTLDGVCLSNPAYRFKVTPVLLPTKRDAYVMPADVVDAYRRIYPTADDEFARMVIWLETNAARRPASPKSAPRFVANWFKRVPRIAPQRQAKLDTLAALTGRAMDGGRGRDWPPVRSNGGRLRGAEDVLDVDWRGPDAGAGDVGADVIELPACRIAYGG